MHMVKLGTSANYISKAFDFTHATITQIQIQKFKICQTTITFNQLLVDLMRNMSKGQWEICKNTHLLPNYVGANQRELQDQRGYQFSEELGMFVQSVEPNRAVKFVISILDTLKIGYSITVALRRERVKNTHLATLDLTLFS